MARTTRSVELRTGVRFPYVVQGDPSGVPVLLVHGYAGTWRSFELLLAELPESIHAFAITQRGHDEASRPARGYNVHDFAEDLVAFMDALRLEGAILVGGSSGGLVARRVAIDHPRRVLGLVLLGSPVTLQGKGRVEDMQRTVISKLTDPVDKGFVDDFFRGTVVRAVPQAFLRARVEDAARIPARVWRETHKGLLEEDSVEELGKIVAPSLVVWGDQDTLIRRTEQQMLAATLQRSRLLVYAGAGHVVYWEVPERVAADLVAFVEEIAGAVPNSG